MAKAKLSKQFTTVTTFSKIVALVMFISFPFIGFYLGQQYQQRLDRPFMQEVLYPSTISSPSNPPQKACSMIAKLCPDGSSVGRVGPNCEFAKCPE